MGTGDNINQEFSKRNKNMRITKPIYLLFFIFIGVSACDQKPKELSVGTGNAPARQYSDTQLEMGATVFAKHCATCHGADAAGDPK